MADAIAVMDAAGVEQAVVIGSSMGGRAALDLTLAHPNRVSGLVLIGTAVRGAPYLDINEGPTAELDTMIESAENASGIDEVNRLEAWMWLDGPTADEGRVVGAARDLFLEMNGKALRDARLAWLDGCPSSASRGRSNDAGRDRRLCRRPRGRRLRRRPSLIGGYLLAPTGMSQIETSL